MGKSLLESSLPNLAPDLLLQGVELMLVGMGTVFVFLTLLVLATQAMSRVVMRMSDANSGGQPSSEEIAAITAALALHSRRKGSP
jgi:oxaloacetate decarboxylase gamma subunit